MKSLLTKALVPVFISLASFSGCGKSSPPNLPDQKRVISGMTVALFNEDPKIYEVYSDGKPWGSIAASRNYSFPMITLSFTDTFIVETGGINPYKAHSIDIRTTISGSTVIYDCYNPKNWADAEDGYSKDIRDGKFVTSP